MKIRIEIYQFESISSITMLQTTYKGKVIYRCEKTSCIFIIQLHNILGIHQLHSTVMYIVQKYAAKYTILVGII